MKPVRQHGAEESSITMNVFSKQPAAKIMPFHVLIQLNSSGICYESPIALLCEES